MLCTCWSAKGGSGTTVVSALLALEAKRGQSESLLVDAVGDLPSALGIATPDSPGMGEWVQAAEAPPDALLRIETSVAPGVGLIHRGRGSLEVPQRLQILTALLEGDGRVVVVDGGTAPRAANEPQSLLLRHLTSFGGASFIVTRPCYLALQRSLLALESGLCASGVIVVDEPDRSLDERDVASVLGLPVVATVPVEPAVARAVDAGLLVSRRPRRASRALAGVL